MRAKCSHCVRVSTARELGVSGLKELIDQFYVRPDNLAIRYGMRFEEALEQELIENLGEKIKMPLDRNMDATLELMNEGVPVIYQGAAEKAAAEAEAKAAEEAAAKAAEEKAAKAAAEKEAAAAKKLAEEKAEAGKLS